jgi:uncharacterized protein (DUF1015 family)
LDFVKTTQDEPKFGLKAWGEYYFCTPKDWQSAKNKLGAGVAQLSVTWSDEFILRDLAGIQPDERSQKITYEKHAPLIVDRAMPSDIAIFHAAPPIEAITRVADESGFMPQKSTYFYPKLFAGLTLRRAAP